MCHSLAELRAAMASFDGCPLAATATNLVFGDGTPESGLMLVGEGPGAEEDRAGLPFVGPSGKLLNRMLASVGLYRSTYYITNLIPWRPPGNRNPTDSEVVVCLPFLLRHIALVRPKIMVMLGNLSVQAVTGTKTGITRSRGKWQDIRIPDLEAPVRSLPMLHPAYLLRNAGAKKDAWADIISLRQALDETA
jgi:DNA polymerase